MTENQRVRERKTDRQREKRARERERERREREREGERECRERENEKPTWALIPTVSNNYINRSALHDHCQ